MPDEKALDTRGLRFAITVPCDDRFRPILGLLCARLARYVGYAESEAAALAGTVAQATDDALTDDDSGYTSIELTIATNDFEIVFHVRYLREGGRGSAGFPSIRERLSAPRGAESVLEGLQRGMRRVDVGLADGVEFCTLTTALPVDAP